MTGLSAEILEELSKHDPDAVLFALTSAGVVPQPEPPAAPFNAAELKTLAETLALVPGSALRHAIKQRLQQMLGISGKLVVLESPYAPKEHNGRMVSTEEHVAYARAAMLHLFHLGLIPFASHLLYTQVLDDTKVFERRRGLLAGLEVGERFEQRYFAMDYGLSSGMVEGKRQAEKLGQKTKEFFVPGWDPNKPSGFLDPTSRLFDLNRARRAWLESGDNKALFDAVERAVQDLP